MKWSLDVDFKTRIRPAAFSAILESHESAVTAIQWIHPMNEVSFYTLRIKIKIPLYFVLYITRNCGYGQLYIVRAG